MSRQPPPVLNNPAFLTANFVAQLEVDYQTGSGGSWQEGLTYPEYLGGDNDPVLLTKQIYDADGSPVSGASVQAYALPVSGASGSPPNVLIGSGTTAPDGTIHMAPLDLDQVQQNPDYETADDSINIQVQYDACATGTDTSANCSADPPTPDWQTASFPEATTGGESTTGTVTEYFGTAYDAVLAQQQALDSNGDPVTDQPVTVQAVSQDGSSTTERWGMERRTTTAT